MVAQKENDLDIECLEKKKKNDHMFISLSKQNTNIVIQNNLFIVFKLFFMSGITDRYFNYKNRYFH